MADKKKPDDKTKKPSSKKPSSSTTKKTSTTKSTSAKTAKAPFNKSLYDTLVSNVSVITLHDKTISLLKKDKTLQETVEYYINAIYTYEKAIKPKNEQYEAAKSGYEAITNKTFDLKKLTKSDLDDLEDKIHFLTIYLKNTIDLEWEEVVASFSKNKSQSIQNPLLAAAVTADAASKTSKTETVEAQHTEFNASDYMRKNHVTMDQIAEGMIEQQAQAILWADIVNGKFYKYKTKPTFFVWAKWILFGLWILTAIALIVLQFIPFSVSKNYLFIYGNEIHSDWIYTAPSSGGGGSNPSTFAASSTIIQLKGQPISNYVFPIYKNNTSNIMFAILSLFIPIFIIWYAWGQVKNNKNENARFTCKTFITWFLLIYVFQIIWISTKNPNLMNFAKLSEFKNVTFGNYTEAQIVNDQGIPTNNPVFALDQHAAYNILMSIWVTQVVYIVLVSLTVLVSIAIIATRPKIDFERRNQRLAQIKEDIKSGNIDQDLSSGGPFGGMRNPFSPF